MPIVVKDHSRRMVFFSSFLNLGKRFFGDAFIGCPAFGIKIFNGLAYGFDIGGGVTKE